MVFFPVLDLYKSPDARLHPVSVCAVTLRDGFWQPRRVVNASQTIPSQFEQLQGGECLGNFRRVIAGEKGEHARRHDLQRFRPLQMA